MDPLQFFLGFLTVASAGGFVQLVVFLLRRRAEIKDLNAKAKLSEASADSSLLDSATAYAAQLQATVTGQMTMADRLNWRITDLESKLDAERNAAQHREEIAGEEIRRLSSRVAQLTTNLAIANNRVEELSQELTAAKGRHQL